MPRRPRQLPVPKRPSSSSRASATRQVRNSMRKEGARLELAEAPNFKQALLQQVQKVTTGVRRYWKVVQRAGSVVVRGTGIDKVVGSFWPGLPRSLTADSPEPQVATSTAGERLQDTQLTIDTPARPRGPLRVRFSSLPGQTKNIPLLENPQSPHRVQKAGTRMSDQQKARRSHVGKLDSIDLSAPSLGRTRQQSQLRTLETHSSTNDQMGNSALKTKGSTSDIVDPKWEPSSADADPKPDVSYSLKGSQTDLSAALGGLELGDAKDVVDAAKEAAPRRRSSTRLTLSSKLLSLPKGAEDERKDQDTVSRRRDSAPQILAPQVSLPSGDVEEAKVAPATSLVSSRRRSQFREDTRRRAKEQAKARRLAILAQEEEEERARRLAEQQAHKAQEDADRAREAQRRGLRATPNEPVIAPLSAEWEHRVNAALDAPAGKVLAETPHAVTRRDLGTLLPQRGTADSSIGWLNDTVIAAAMTQVVAHGLARTGHKRGAVPKFHAYSTFFYTEFKSKGYEKVRRYGKRAGVMGANLLQCEMVFIPVHKASHWTLLVVYPMARAIEYYDSLSGYARPFLDDAKAWLANELGEHWNEDEWVTREGDSPQQNNGKDCGVFLVTTAKMLMLGWNPAEAYDSRFMVTQRRRIAAEILAGGYQDDLAPPEAPGRWVAYGGKRKP